MSVLITASSKGLNDPYYMYQQTGCILWERRQVNSDMAFRPTPCRWAPCSRLGRTAHACFLPRLWCNAPSRNYFCATEIAESKKGIFLFPLVEMLLSPKGTKPLHQQNFFRLTRAYESLRKLTRAFGVLPRSDLVPRFTYGLEVNA